MAPCMIMAQRGKEGEMMQTHQFGRSVHQEGIAFHRQVPGMARLLLPYTVGIPSFATAE